MRKRAMIGCGLAALVLTVASACGGSSQGDGTTPDPAAFAGPIRSTDPAGGEQAFKQLCGSCHPGGNEGIGPNLHNIAWSPARMRQQIREGSAEMAPISSVQFPDDKMEASLAYMVTLGAVADEAGTPTEVPDAEEQTE